MNVQHSSLIETCKRVFFGRREEQLLCTTFWANDFKRGQEYDIDGRTYRITRYVRASDARFFEVWGQEVQPSTSMVRGRLLA